MNISELFSAVPAIAPQALYIDPSTVTVAVSSISGIVIALGATFAILWTRAKKKASKALHIDVNAHKEVEEELVIKDENSNAPGQGETKQD